MKKLIICTLFATSVFIVIPACKKAGAGPGGSSSIVGKVYVMDYNQTFTILDAEYYAMDKEVYLIYGDEPSYGERTRTSYDGAFAFTSLRKGDYTVYVYSKDSTLQSPNGKIAKIVEATITENKQTVELDEDIDIFN